MVEMEKQLKPETKHVVNSSLFDMLMDDNSFSEFNSNVENDILELLFKLYELIDYTKKGKIEKIDAVESFVLSYDSLLAFIRKLDSDNKYQSDIERFVKFNEKKLLKMINGRYTVEQVCNMLTNMLKETEDLKSLVQGNGKKSILNIIPKSDNQKDVLTGEFSFDLLDQLYRDLYDAINKDNSKLITVTRGRLIKELKRNQDNIDSSYENISCLVEIKKLLKHNDRDLSKVAVILRKEENKKYLEYFGDSFADYSSFVLKFNKLCEELKVDKIVLYKNALSEELKEHKSVLKQRYSSEFLEKKAGLTSVVTMLPNAVGLAVKELNNSINQLKNAKTNRDKVDKTLEVVKSSGKLIGTPVVYAGKFVLNNWYAFYALTKNFLNNKVEKENTDDKTLNSSEGETLTGDVNNNQGSGTEGTTDTPVDGGTEGETTVVDGVKPGEKPNLPTLVPGQGDLVEGDGFEQTTIDGTIDETVVVDKPELPKLPNVNKPTHGKPGFEEIYIWDGDLDGTPSESPSTIPGTTEDVLPEHSFDPDAVPEAEPSTDTTVTTNPTTTETTSPVVETTTWTDYFFYPYWFAFDANSTMAPYEPVAGYGASSWNNMVTEHNLEVLQNYKDLFEDWFGFGK